MMNKIYISGPISGYDLKEQRKKFAHIEKALRVNAPECGVFGEDDDSGATLRRKDEIEEKPAVYGYRALRGGVLGARVADTKGADSRRPQAMEERPAATDAHSFQQSEPRQVFVAFQNAPCGLP